MTPDSHPPRPPDRLEQARAEAMRLDRAVHADGLAPSREKARALVIAGRIRVNGCRADKPGRRVRPEDRLEMIGSDRPLASRGGGKVVDVLPALQIDVRGFRCLDVGASTGGFTDVLLRAGAAHVVAIDVGRGLLDARLAADPRVLNVEGVNARYLDPARLDPPYDFALCDLSFISLEVVLPRILPLLPAGRILALVKPQFEVGPEKIGRGGVVRDPNLRKEAVRKVADFLRRQGWTILGVRESPLAGPKGNREVFLYAGAGGEDQTRALGPESFERRLDEEISP